MKTLDEVRAFVAHEASRLEPASGNVRALSETIDASGGIGDLLRRLNSGGYGRHWAGAAVFAAMSLPDKLRASLIPCENVPLRPDAPELAFLRHTVLPLLAHRHDEAQVLSLPCAHGLEAIALAGECAAAGLRSFAVHGIDAQRACIDAARAGSFPYPGQPHVQCMFDAALASHLRFRTADVFRHPLGGPFDVIVCRNLLGFFTSQHAHKAALALCGALRAENAFLFVDDLALEKHAQAFDGLPLRRIGGLPVFCVLPAATAST